MYLYVVMANPEISDFIQLNCFLKLHCILPPIVKLFTQLYSIYQIEMVLPHLNERNNYVYPPSVFEIPYESSFD